MTCPKCHNTEDFVIHAVCYEEAYVHQVQPGEEEVYGLEAGNLELYDTKGSGGTEWDGDSMTRCLDCQYMALLQAFDPQQAPPAA